MVSTRYETCDWLSIRSNGVFSSYVVERVGLISAWSSGRSHLIHLQNKNRYKLVINWCHNGTPRSVFGATSTTTQIFRNTHDTKTPIHALGGVAYTLPGDAAPLTLCFAAKIFWRFQGFMTSNWSLFNIITQNYRTWILLVKMIISNQNNYSTWYFQPPTHPQLLLRCSTHAYMWTKT